MMWMFVLMAGGVQFEPVWQLPLETLGITRSVSVAVSEEGLLCLAPSSGVSAYLVDRNGRFLKKTGAFGAGPGGFRSIVRIHYLPAAGIFALQDRSNARVSYLNTRGVLLPRRHEIPDGISGLAFPEPQRALYLRKSNTRCAFYIYDFALSEEAKLWEIPHDRKPGTDRDAPRYKSSPCSGIRFSFGKNFLVFYGSDRKTLTLRPLVSGQAHRESSRTLPADHSPQQIMVDPRERIWVFGEKNGFHPFLILDRNLDRIGQGVCHLLPAAIDGAHLYLVERDDATMPILQKCRFRISESID